MKEIEKKYLLLNNDDLKCFIQGVGALSIKRIEQSYLSVTEKEEVRIRSSHDLKTNEKLFTLTIKSSGDAIRDEVEIPINGDTFNNLLQSVNHNSIILKDRYSVKVNEFIIEVDIYKEELDYLAIAEVEVSSIDDLDKLKFMLNFSFVKEDVTQNKSYKNKNLWKMISGI